MTARMAKLDRVLTLVHALTESADGLTLDEMAGLPGVNRRTAEHLFTWAGEVVIEGPEALRAMMGQRLAAGAGCLRPEMSCEGTSGAT